MFVCVRMCVSVITWAAGSLQAHSKWGHNVPFQASFGWLRPYRDTSVAIVTTNTGTVATKPGCPVWCPERLGIPDISLANQMVTYGYPICCKPMRCLSCATLTRATAAPTGWAANGGTAASAMLLCHRKRVGSTESKRPADLLKQ